MEFGNFAAEIEGEVGTLRLMRIGGPVRKFYLPRYPWLLTG